MGSFLLSLLIFILFGGIGTLISMKIPKIDINIPEPIITISTWGCMGASFYYESDRIFQIFFSFIIGLVCGYLLNCIEK